VWAIVGISAWAVAADQHWPWVWSVVVAAAFVSATVCWRWMRLTTRDPVWVAHHIEAGFPELGASLLTALEQAPEPRTRRLSYLQYSVVKDAVQHGRQRNWTGIVPAGRLRLAQLANVVCLLLLIGACSLLVGRKDAAARLTATTPDGPLIPTEILDVDVQPGNTEIERGTTLLVVARFASGLPAEASLVVEDVVADPTEDAADTEKDADERIRTRTMVRSLDDPQFVGRVPAVANDMQYTVEFAGQESPTYRVTVFDYPALERADVRLNYPSFTSLEPKLIEDVRHVTAVEGTELTILCRLNKEVVDARLIDRDGEALVLERTDDETPVYAATITLSNSRRFKLHLKDADDRENELPAEFVVNVKQNRPPTLKIAKPGHDVRVSPIEELGLMAELSDDFGLLRYGMSYSLGGGEPTEIVLSDSDGEDEPAIEKRNQFEHLIDFEALDAEPDQLVSYYVWAEDAATGDQIRQTMSDMYFAEVRHFEEIFRQGEQPTEQQQREQQQQQQQEGEQGNGERAEQLAELQKEIVNATWKLIRRETLAEPTDPFADDALLVQQSQQEALDQLDELAGEIVDEESLQHVEVAREAMETVLQHATAAAEGPATGPLRPALSAEQQAYQALLKLRAREFNVVEGGPQQGPSSGSGSGGGNRSQQQLNQLELSAEENRYETQSRAQNREQQQGEQGAGDESRQFLDRLRELARRQEDLNERVRELQSELEAAENETERDEIERELKRLREQQREVLRDTDELQNDMENSENSEQLQEPREQLEETRSRVQQASEALDEGQLSEAVTEGTRAGRELNELRDDFRRRTADRFSEEMRELRDTARELDERQQQLSEQLAAENESRNQTLRDRGMREEIGRGLAEQQRQLGELVEQMQETVQEAEEPEPLLAQQLYDTVRQVSDQNVEQALDMAQQLVDIGVTREATDAMEAADRGIGQLREGVERAASSVLGSETEALRRAEQELEDLADQLNREIQDAQGSDNQDGQPGEPSEASDGQRSENPAAPGEGQQPSSGEPGEASGNREQQEQQQQQQAGGGRGGSEPGEPNDGPNNGPNDEPNDRQLRQGTPGGESEPQEPNDDEQPPRPGQATGQPGQDGQPRQGGGRGGLPDGFEDFLDEFTNPGGPITGEDFRPWADRLRNVEDLLDDPELSSEAARILDRAEAARAEYRRHSKVPDWTKLQELVAEPLVELRRLVADEIRRQQSPDALVPIDRDPVPAEYSEAVRLYFERLGSGQ
jgi:hypothetical protein